MERSSQTQHGLNLCTRHTRQSCGDQGHSQVPSLSHQLMVLLFIAIGKMKKTDLGNVKLKRSVAH